MRFLIISGFFFLVFTSCSIPTLKGLKKTEATEIVYVNPYFSNPEIDYVYKAKITAFDNFFGGILIIKKIKEQQHRIVFTTDFGNKIFDFEITKNTFKTLYILPQLDRNIILKTLERDFKMLTQEQNLISKTYENEFEFTYQSKRDKRYNHYIIDKKTKLLKRIVQTSRSREKTIIYFDSIKNNRAKILNIQHKNLDLNISLAFLNKS